MIFVTLSAYTVAVLMKETYKPVILKRRAKRCGIETMEDQDKGEKLRNVLVLKVLRPFHMLFTEVSYTSGLEVPANMITASPWSSSSPCIPHSLLACSSSYSPLSLISFNAHHTHSQYHSLD